MIYLLLLAIVIGGAVWYGYRYFNSSRGHEEWETPVSTEELAQSPSTQEQEPQPVAIGDQASPEPIAGIAEGHSPDLSMSFTDADEASETDPPDLTSEKSVPHVRGSLPPAVIEELSEMISEFPPLPFNTAGILAEMRGKNVDTRRVTALVGQDPVLSAALLRIANSAFYAQNSEVTSTERAVLLLGHDVVLSVALRGALAGLVAPQGDGGYDSLALLRHSVVTGLWSGALARKVGRVEQAEAVTAGLLHDLGKIVINTARPRDAKDILYPESTLFGESLLAKEERIVGATHAVIGAMLCARWKLPSILTDAVELHHHPAVATLAEYSPRIRELTAVIFVANQLAKLSGCQANDAEIDLASAALLSALDLPNNYDLIHQELLHEVKPAMSAFLGEAKGSEET